MAHQKFSDPRSPSQLLFEGAGGTVGPRVQLKGGVSLPPRKDSTGVPAFFVPRPRFRTALCHCMLIVMGIVSGVL